MSHRFAPRALLLRNSCPAARPVSAAIRAAAAVVGLAVVAGAVFGAPVAARALPMVVDDAYELGAEAPFESVPGAGLLANDVEVASPGAHLSVETPPQHGAITRVDDAGDFAYSPAAGFRGTDRFTYCIKTVVSGSSCSGGVATVSLIVKPHVERIPGEVRAELTRLQPTPIVILGGLESISAQVEAELGLYLAH